MFAEELERLYDYKEGGKYVYRGVMAKEIELVDPAPRVAGEMYEYFVQGGKVNDGKGSKSRVFIRPDNHGDRHVYYEVSWF